MQLVLAIVPPRAVADSIAAFQVETLGSCTPPPAGPHVTVKAQPGLTTALLPRVAHTLSTHAPFSLTLDGVAMFADVVAYLHVVPAPALLALHRLLVDAVTPDPVLAAQYFEGDGYTPHLTLAMTAQGFTTQAVRDVADRARRRFPQPITFDATAVTVFRQEGSDESYYPTQDFPLGS